MQQQPFLQEEEEEEEEEEVHYLRALLVLPFFSLPLSRDTLALFFHGEAFSHFVTLYTHLFLMSHIPIYLFPLFQSSSRFGVGNSSQI